MVQEPTGKRQWKVSVEGGSLILDICLNTTLETKCEKCAVFSFISAVRKS